LLKLDEELSFKLQDDEEEQARLAREKAEKVEEANISWDNVQVMIEADRLLAERLQARDQEELKNEEKARLFIELLEKRKKHFAALRAQQKRNKPPTKAQKKSTMSTYLKHMVGYKQSQLKNKLFAEIQKLFDKAMTRVNMFVDKDTELVKESLKKAEAEMAEETSSKRAGEELEQEPTKKQKVDDDKEREYLQQCFELVTEVDVAIDAIPLATKPAPIVNFQIQRKRRNGYYEIMRADGSAKTYLLPEEGYERVLWGDLKNMFEHHIEDEVWRSLQGKKGMIVRIKSFIWLFGITAALIKVSAAQEERYLELKRKAQAKANDGGTYFFDRIWIPLVGGVRKLIMDEAHTSRYSVHPGADKMYCDLRDLYWWPEILDWKWEKITMDLVTELPKSSSRYDVIWVIVDRLTKSAHFLPIHRDGQFASHLYKALQEALGTRLDMITAYHPQTDGQSISMERSGTVGKKGKLAPKYVGPFEIVEYVGPVAYRLKLPQELSCIHDTFHVSNLKKCLVESDVQVPLEEIEIDENLRFVEEPIEIVERDVKKLKRRRIPLVKVRWNS
ncbi:putative reverse transcriptase domain-containing protein, partial [Tanacetum coccineum]